MEKETKFTHEQGMAFLTALVALIYNFVKSFKRNKNVNVN